MPRPRLHYVVWEDGKVVAVVQGREAAKKIGPSFRAYRLRADAEEAAAWWDYLHARHDHSTKHNEQKR